MEEMSKKEISREDVCSWLAGKLADADKARAIEEEMTKEGPSQVRDWLASVAEQSARLREQQESGELYRRLVAKRNQQEGPDEGRDLG